MVSWSGHVAHPGNYHSPESQCSRGFRGHSLSLGYTEHSGFSPGGIRESRDTWRLGGLPEEGFHSALGDRWQSPKGGPAGASAESSNGGIRQGFEKASKMGRVFRGHVSDSEGSPKESRPGWWV